LAHKINLSIEIFPQSTCFTLTMTATNVDQPNMSVKEQGTEAVRAKDVEMKDAATDKEESTDTNNTKTEETSTSKDNDGYFGKYNWNGKKTSKVSSNDGILGDNIPAYSWSDGKKKVSVYVTLDGFDDLPDDAFSVKLAKDKKGFRFEARMNDTKKKVLLVDNLNATVSEAKVIRKKGKNMAVIKLTKEKERTWYNLKGYGSGGGYDYDDWSDAEEDFDLPPMDEDAINDDVNNKEDQDTTKKCEETEKNEEEKKESEPEVMEQ
jgi:hypothetical protein